MLSKNNIFSSVFEEIEIKFIKFNINRLYKYTEREHGWLLLSKAISYNDIKH